MNQGEHHLNSKEYFLLYNKVYLYDDEHSERVG